MAFLLDAKFPSEQRVLQYNFYFSSRSFCILDVQQMIWSIPNFFDKIIYNCIIGIISEVWMPLMQFSHMCACAGFVCFSPLCMIDKTSLLGIKETKLLLNSRLYILSLKHIYWKTDPRNSPLTLFPRIASWYRIITFQNQHPPQNFLEKRCYIPHC